MCVCVSGASVVVGDAPDVEAFCAVCVVGDFGRVCAIVYCDPPLPREASEFVSCSASNKQSSPLLLPRSTIELGVRACSFSLSLSLH